MQEIQRHLLVIGCSRRKRSRKESISALERYDGNSYRVIRKLKREDHWPFLVDIMILSAEFGLISADRSISYYDRRMDEDRATDLRPEVLGTLAKHLGDNLQYGSVYVDLGRDYLPAVQGIEDLFGGTPVTYAKGRIGERLSALKEWLLERWCGQPIVPFFVADRPMSLRILKGVPLQDYPGARIGIMAHANTTLSFQKKLDAYPCENPNVCDAVDGKECPYQGKVEQCPTRSYIVEHTIKMCDSGIFTKEGATLSYEDLFDAYVRMGVKYGVMIDVMHDPEATLESAEKALEAYDPYRREFHLVGVAQGRTLEGYLKSYSDLKEMGYTHVAVGGLLQRVEKSVRFTQVRDETFMYQVLGRLREAYPDDWLFALGSFHPSRLGEFSQLNVWGDYKGWIFQYEKTDDSLNEILERVRSNDLQHLDAPEMSAEKGHVAKLRESMSDRRKLMKNREETHERLLETRREVREDMAWLYQKLRADSSEIADQLEPILTHVLMKDTEKRVVESAVAELDERDEERGNRLLSEICDARDLKDELMALDERIAAVNESLADTARTVSEEMNASSELAARCREIVRLTDMTEREYRLAQVRQHIASEILAPQVAATEDRTMS